MPVTILVAEDSVTMRRIMEMTFAGEDAQVITVANGDEALAKASEIRPNIIFADLSLPDMDGYEIARQVKSKPTLEKTAVIVMVGQKGPFDENKAREAGVDDHVVKPFDTQQIIDRVKQVLAAPRAMPVTGVRPIVAAPTPEPVTAAQKIKTKTATIGFGVSPASASAQEHQPTLRMAQQPLPKAPLPASRPAPIPPVEARPREEPSARLAEKQEGLKRKLDAIGLKPEQIEAVLELSREVIEKVVWEVVPDLAETIIREEIKRLTAE
ncbi:MAG: response regulator [Deltaproteobacteria bacterium]|nr:response regulator [Deltaproteobacteria bacterium]